MLIVQVLTDLMQKKFEMSMIVELGFFLNMCKEFTDLMQNKFEMSMIVELRFSFWLASQAID